MKKDFYKILEVDKNASQDDIKRSYRKLSMQWHPDRHVSDSDEDKKKAEEKFKEIAEAYSVLSDPEKRKRYDNGGDEAFGGFGDVDLNDILNHMRSNFGRGFGFGFGFNENKEQIEPIILNVTLTNAEAFSGTKKTLTFTRNEPCQHCNGKGGEGGIDISCPHCHGTGVITETTQVGPGSFSMQQKQCTHCNGTGKTNANPCTHCNGTGYTKKSITETFNIPAGVFEGAQMKISGGGNYSRTGERGDIYIQINIIEDPYFQRVDMTNVMHTEEINWIDAMLGCEKEIKKLDGTTFKLKIPECTEDGTSFVQYGQGFPNVNNPRGNRGDFAVLIKYKYPKSLTEKERKILEELRNK